MFSHEGYFTIGTDRVPAPRGMCDEFVTLDLDDLVGDEAIRAAGLSNIRECLGDRSLMALVNNAAVQVLGAIEELTSADWAATLNVNLLAPFFLAQGLLDELENGPGTVINIASVHARLTKPSFVAYATSKAALVGLTRSMAVELGPRVRVNAIAPAAVDSDLLKASFADSPDAYQDLADCHPVRRVGRPEEVAEVALFLASPRANFMSGSVLALDGAVGVRLHDPT